MKSTTLLKFIFISFLFICQAGMAQVKIGAKAGYSAGRLTDNSDNIYAGDFESSSGVDIGVTAEFPLSELFSLQTELIYTQRGGTRDGLQPIPTSSLESLGSLDDLNYLLSLQGKDPVTDENPMYADFSNSFELNYLEIPILGKLGWGNYRVPALCRCRGCHRDRRRGSAGITDRLPRDQRADRNFPKPAPGVTTPRTKCGMYLQESGGGFGRPADRRTRLEG